MCRRYCRSRRTRPPGWSGQYDALPVRARGPAADASLRGRPGFRARPAARNASHPPNQDSAVAVPRDDGGCHLMVEGKALGNDLGRVVGAMLQRGPREQPAAEFGVVGLQVQRHVRGHPEFAADQVGRPGLVSCSAGFRPGQTRLRPPWRRSSPPAACQGRSGRVRARRGQDTPGWPGREWSASRRDRAAAHRSRCGGCRSARRSARPESPFPRPAARPSVLACSSPPVIIPPTGRPVDSSCLV